MILSKIWERYFLRETIKLVVLFIVCFYGLYVLIDYSSHSRTFHHYIHYKWYQIALYYACEFSHRLDILLPFALLVATIRTLYNMNVHNELVALMAGGFRLKRLMIPFIVLAIFFVGAEYINYQYVMPKALKQLRTLNEMRTVEKNKKQQIQSVQSIVLEDHSTLIFLKYDHTQQRFYDTYWIRSIDDIYRIKYLYPHQKTPIGNVVEHLERNKEGLLQEKEAHLELAFKEMRFNKKRLLETLTPSEEQSLVSLWAKTPQNRDAVSEKEAILVSTFYRRLVMPWLCLLAVMGPIPFCVNYSRNQPIFFIYAFSLFGLVATYLMLDAAVILGKRQVFTPEWAILLPFFFVSSIIAWRFSRIR